MSNTLERQIVLDGWRNAVVKFAGVIDTADVVDAPALLLSELLNNEKNVTLYALRVDRVEYAMSDNLELFLEWDSSLPQQICPLAGRGKFCAKDSGGWIPDTTRAGFNGAINLRTQTYMPGTVANFTVTVEFVKMYR